MFSHKDLTQKGSAFLPLGSVCLAQPEENQGLGDFQGCECKGELLNSTENINTENCCVQLHTTLSMELQLKTLQQDLLFFQQCHLPSCSPLE